MSYHFDAFRGILPEEVIKDLNSAIDQVRVAIFSNSNRPNASKFPPGTRIWNSDANASEYSDGTNWRDGSGNLT